MTRKQKPFANFITRSVNKSPPCFKDAFFDTQNGAQEKDSDVEFTIFQAMLNNLNSQNQFETRRGLWVVWEGGLGK